MSHCRARFNELRRDEDAGRIQVDELRERLDRPPTMASKFSFMGIQFEYTDRTQLDQTPLLRLIPQNCTLADIASIFGSWVCLRSSSTNGGCLDVIQLPTVIVLVDIRSKQTVLLQGIIMGMLYFLPCDSVCMAIL